MSTISGTITDAHLVQADPDGNSNRKTYLLLATFGTYTASSDDGAIVTVPTAVGNITKSGKTLTMRQAMGACPGNTSAGAAVYALNGTVSGSTLVCDLGTTTAEANCAAATGVGFLVSFDES